MIAGSTLGLTLRKQIVKNAVKWRRTDKTLDCRHAS